MKIIRLHITGNFLKVHRTQGINQA